VSLLINLSLFINKNHQFTPEKTLSLPLEKIAKSQKLQCFLFSNSLHKECATSSITSKLFFLANFKISFIGAVFQKVCCTIITFVLSVIWAFNSSKSKLKFFLSIST
jgi:hypothetical protein